MRRLRDKIPVAAMADPDRPHPRGHARFDIMIAVANHPRIIAFHAQSLTSQKQRRWIGLVFSIFAGDANIKMQPMPAKNGLHASPGVAGHQRSDDPRVVDPFQQLNTTGIERRFLCRPVLMSMQNPLGDDFLFCRHPLDRFQNWSRSNADIAPDLVKIQQGPGERPIHVEQNRLR